MQKTFSTYHSYFTKALLGLAFIWSVFLFSGYVENEVFTLPETASIELIGTKAKTPPIVSFQKVQAFSFALSIQQNSYFRTVIALNDYNTLIASTFLQLQKASLNYTFWRPILPNKCFPISTDKDGPFFC